MCQSLDIEELRYHLISQDDKFLNVLYPNYINWLLQPLKYSMVNTSEDTMFGLAENIMELLTFCTQNHGYRIKYLFGRQPVAMYVRQMLQSKNKPCVIRKSLFLAYFRPQLIVLCIRRGNQICQSLRCTRWSVLLKISHHERFTRSCVLPFTLR